MKEFDEETALSILFGNTKRKKRSADLLTIAENCEYLVKLYGSQKTVAERVGISTEMIRELLIALKLPTKIQELVAARKIDSIDIIREISALKEPSEQIAAAEALIGSSSKDVRDIKRLVKSANLPAGEAKKTIINAKPKGLHIFVIDFDDGTYQALIKQAKALKIKPAELVRGIVTNWLNQETKESE